MAYHPHLVHFCACVAEAPACHGQVDRPSATEERCGQVASQLFDLFAQLGASEEQLDFPVLYASARQVRATRNTLPSVSNGERCKRMIS